MFFLYIVGFWTMLWIYPNFTTKVAIPVFFCWSVYKLVRYFRKPSVNPQSTDTSSSNEKASSTTAAKTVVGLKSTLPPQNVPVDSDELNDDELFLAQQRVMND